MSNQNISDFRAPGAASRPAVTFVEVDVFGLDAFGARATLPRDSYFDIIEVGALAGESPREHLQGLLLRLSLGYSREASIDIRANSAMSMTPR